MTVSCVTEKKSYNPQTNHSLLARLQKSEFHLWQPVKVFVSYACLLVHSISKSVTSSSVVKSIEAGAVVLVVLPRIFVGYSAVIRKQIYQKTACFCV